MTQETEYATFALGCSTADDVIERLAHDNTYLERERTHWQWMADGMYREMERNKSRAVAACAIGAVSGALAVLIAQWIWRCL